MAAHTYHSHNRAGDVHRLDFVFHALSARVPERQKNKNGGLDQYGFEHFVV